MIDKKTAQTWSDMAKKKMENDWKITDISKVNVETPLDILNAVDKYISKRISGTAKVTGNTFLIIDLKKIRKNIESNEKALIVLGKNNLTIDNYVFKTIIEMLDDNGFYTELRKDVETIGIGW